MELDYPHSFSADEAKSRLEALGKYLQAKHGIAVNWDGSTGRFDGKYLVVSIQGEFTVEEAMVKLRGKDPGFMWRKKATEYMRHKLDQYLDPSKGLDSLPVA